MATYKKLQEKKKKSSHLLGNYQKKTYMKRNSSAAFEQYIPKWFFNDQ